MLENDFFPLIPQLIWLAKSLFPANSNILIENYLSKNPSALFENLENALIKKAAHSCCAHGGIKQKLSAQILRLTLLS